MEHVFLECDHFCRHILAEGLVVFHKQDRRLELNQQFFDLHPGDHVDIVHRLIPDVQVGRFADGFCQQYLLDRKSVV